MRFPPGPDATLGVALMTAFSLQISAYGISRFSVQLSCASLGSRVPVPQQHGLPCFLLCVQEGTDVVLVQEYAEGGDLYRLLHKNGGRLSERQAVEMVLHPFLLSLHYLHTRGKYRVCICCRCLYICARYLCTAGTNGTQAIAICSHAR